MKTVKQKKWISIILVIVIMLTGMCFENTKADSYFWYTDCKENQSTLDISRCVLINQDLCTQDLIGERTSNSTFSQESQSNIKSNSKLRIVLSLLENLPENPTYISESTIENVVCNTTYSSVAIISYIHRQDGKKA